MPGPAAYDLARNKVLPGAPTTIVACIKVLAVCLVAPISSAWIRS
jgi:hypothetical protein